MHTSSVTSGSSTSVQNPLFIKELTNAIKLGKKAVWHNNNLNMQFEAHIKYIKDPDEVKHIFSTLLELKKKYNDQTFTALPTAGCKPIKVYSLGGTVSEEQRKKRMDKEYRQSFSLSPHATGENSLYLKVDLKSQLMDLVKLENETVLRVTGGVRIKDADEFLHKEGWALVENQTTIQMITFGGTGTGPYGPSKNHQSMTTNTLRMDIITPLGKRMTLSDSENSKLFKVFRDCHLGVFYSEYLYIKIVPKFLLKRHDQCFKDVAALKLKTMKEKNNLINKDHFIAMYLPVDIKEKGDHFPRFRITNFERTNETLPENTKNEHQVLLEDYEDLMGTEAGEVIIDRITKCDNLRKHFPFVIKAAAYKTYGFEDGKTEINWSPQIAHIFHTYTDLPIRDINWLIQVDNPKHANEVWLDLIERTETALIELAESEQYPLLNAFSRYIKGLSYPKGEGAIAPTGVDEEGQDVLSFEFVTYEPLAQTKAFKKLVDIVQSCLKERNLKVHFHPGKHFPDEITSLTQTFTGPIRELRLKNFQAAVFEIHENDLENLKHSPTLSEEKKRFIGLSDMPEKIPSAMETKEVVTYLFTKKQENETLKEILKHAEQNKELHASTIKNVKDHLQANKVEKKLQKEKQLQKVL